MSRSLSPSTQKRYGLHRVCRLLEMARSTVYAGLGDRSKSRPKRRGPVGPCPDDELVEKIRSVLTDSPFHGEGYRKVWARLRFRGIRTTRTRVLRLMGDHYLPSFRRIKRPAGPKAHDGTITTERVNAMWGTDLTTCFTLEEGQASIFFAVDHCTTECTGIHAARNGTRFEALEPIRQGVRKLFGSFRKDVAKGLSLRHDHGSQFMSHDFQEEISFLGINSSPAFVRQPQGNGCAESFVRTLKENLLWLRSFRNVEGLRQALLSFKDEYNTRWILQRHGYKTPAQVRAAQTAALETAA